MKGVVRVGPQPSQAKTLSLFVGDYEAEYITDSGVSAPSNGGCTPDTNPLDNCNTTQPATDNNNGTFQFAFWDCLTPVVTDISPNQGAPETVIKISGYGFGTETCQNQITINDHNCVTQTANETLVECVIDTNDTFSVGNYDTVYMNVLGKGDAVNAIRSPVGRTFRMVPAIYELSQHKGSEEGGTRLVINGSGFSAATNDDISINICGGECVIENIEYTAVTCVTSIPTSNVRSCVTDITINNVEAVCSGNCSFEFTSNYTPTISSVSPVTVSGESTTLNIGGSGFSIDTANITVTVGGVDCIVTSAADDSIECDVGYVPAGDAVFVVNIEGSGNSAFNDSDHATLYSNEIIDSVDPVSGSLEGGQVITIIGNGFHEDDTAIDIGGSECIIQSINISQIVCNTTSHSAGTVTLVVTSGEIDYPAETYDYANGDTPSVTSVSPTSGVSGDNITISGTGFSSTDAENTITIDGVECSVTSSGASSLECDVGVHSAGTYVVVVHVQGKGYASSSTEFEYSLAINSVSPTQGSFGGGPTLELQGAGFGTADDTTVTVCDNVCEILNITENVIECDVPPNSGTGSTEDCDIVVTIDSGATVTESDAWQYREDLTPVIELIDPPRGGTGGGTTLNITGTGFGDSGNKVYIAGTECVVRYESTTEISCRTGAHSPSVETTVRVDVPNKGVALRENASYYYVDVWSSKYTWGGYDPPIEGDFVVVPDGQTLLLDTSTPILKMLLIQGGSVIFDEVDLTLNSEYILIVDGGLLQVGTEQEPFQHQATIMMHGHVGSKELPLYGAKTLAVREGTLDLHGKHIPVTWTYLAQTINAGDTSMTLIEPVTWEIGDQIVIAATTHKHSQRENEELTITGVSADGMTLTFEPAVEYEHISVLQTIDGVTLETRAEVGLLTRNVVVRGSVHSEWTDTIEACEAEFNTNQFVTQTCFRGRFGEETASDQYGAAIMLFAKEPDKHLATGRLSYIEVTHAGQAFRLGRYAIHFHLNGKRDGNYVRGCAIHHTFNRAVTVHAVHHLLVERNVAYNVMGHAYFLEDGIETKNIIQYNLAIFVRSSNSLLNVDVTPAAYWITNADNYVRHNAAAGGSHFGFWYRAPVHPEGPSFTNQICPRNIPVLEFYNNTVHNQGWYGIWIFPIYYPKEGGACNAWASAPAEYYNLTAWHVERGAEAVEVGAVRFINFLISDAAIAGLEYQTSWDAWGGPLIQNSVIIGHSDIAESIYSCTEAGVNLPKSRYLTVDGVKFINFDRDRCAAVRACSDCKPDEGGYQSRFQNIEYFNSPNKARWKWQHECWLEDLDGTLIGESANYKLLPYNPNLPADRCEWGNSDFGSSDLPGAICDETITLHRLAFNNSLPTSLKFKRTVFVNDNGASYINFHKKRLTHPDGWMITLIDGDNYRWFFEDLDHLTNISYDARFEEFSDGNFVLMNHNFTQKPDAVSLTGDRQNGTVAIPSYDADDHGDWNFDNSTKVFTYLISGKGHSNADLSVNLDVYRCFHKDCGSNVPSPPPELPDVGTNTSSRPSNVSLWSDVKTWENAPAGWGSNTGDGSYTGALPQDGEDVMILPGAYVVADTDLPVMRKLFIYGTLELDDTRDFNITATYILIQGGRLIIGYSEEEPFTHNVHILLEGNHFTEDIPLPNGPNLGSKAIGSFGGLDIHGQNRSVFWTHLATPVALGDDTITVAEDTDWEEGDEIIVTSTSYEPWHTETFKILSVTNARTFVLNATFEYSHSVGEHTATDGEVTYAYGLKADVALLTRNIKIEGADYSDLIEESFGARLIVGRFFQDGEMYLGYGRISNVEFYHSGQEGWTDFYDPRYSVAFLDTGPSVGDSLSYVTGCSFHQGFSSAIGLFGAQGVLIQDNIIHHTVGSAVIDYGTGNTFINNLVAVVINPGTYLDRFEEENKLLSAGFEMDKATNPILINNTVAGSERFGYKIKGEPCNEEPTWSGNTVHSTWMGVVLFEKSLAGCSKVANFAIYKCANHGIYTLITSSLHVTDVIMADNKVGITPLIYSPLALSHVKSDKFVRVENSLIVAMSPDYDCGGDDDVTPEAYGIPRNHPAGLAPGSGHVGIKWPTFMSSFNGAPFKPFEKTISYPAIGGRTYVDNVMFVNFQTTCNKQHKMIMTNKKIVDCLHPMEVSNIRLVNVDTDNIVRLHRPNLGDINPADCVDMDCDGMKKAMIRDLDGTLLGSIGTIIPDSAFEWDGDQRRGLGDYRIPPAMVTEIDGSRIPYDDKLPNKGIYRGQNDECEWKSAWTAYECHGIDHMMMVVESLDADTEVRRVSPVALYSDTYVDLINGPQDNGWCSGYTCQERISTFYTVVATRMSYELVFSGPNPQRLRYHLLNSDDTQKVVVGTWYANPQRLDVYVDGKYIMPNNGAIENGEFVWKNDLAPEDYIPDPSSNVYGENFFHRDLSTLYINIRGSQAVDIVTTPVVLVTFGVPAITVDDFFEENLINNLVQFLDVLPSQIRIVEIIAEDSKRRRRAASEAEVVIEVGDPPADSIETEEETSTGTPGTTTAPPTTTPSSSNSTSSSLDFESLTSIQSTLANEMQQGDLGSSLDIQITSLAMTEPAATPEDPTGGVRATNQTAGEANGTTTYAEQQAAEQAEEESNSVVSVVYRIPTQLVVYTQPSGAVEGEPFTVQPQVQVLDALGILVDQLGTKSNPWQLTVSIKSDSGSVYADLIGNTTLPFNNGWVNFTGLVIDSADSDYILDFAITYPNTSTLTVSSESFDVEDREYYAAVVTPPGVPNVHESFDVIVEIRDGETMLAVTNLAEKDFVWQAMASLYDPTIYEGELIGDVDVTFDLATAQAQFSNLFIDAAGYQYILEIQVITVPSSSYDFTVRTDPFDVVDPDTVVHTGEASTLTITFNADYDAIVAGKEDLFISTFLNNIAPMYPDVTITNVAVSKGSIVVTFDIQGDLEGTQEAIAQDLADGDIVLNFDGNNLVANVVFFFDGEEIDGDGDKDGSGSSAFPIWVIPVVIVVAIVMIIIIILLVCKLMAKPNHKVDELEPFHSSSPDNMQLQCTASNKGFETPDLIIHQDSSSCSSDPELQHLTEDVATTRDLSIGVNSPGFRVPSPNTPRRTPEIQVVTALPPGFPEDQEERVLEDRQKMFLMAKNQDGTFLKLGTINVNMVGTVYDLRHDIMSILSDDLKDKKFVMMRETLKDIDGSLEKKLSVPEVYSADCALIRFVNENDESQMCICGLLGQFDCSLCHKQAYCSPGCQSKDWPRHTIVCSQWSTKEHKF
ncbi:LOW QUALITY PROTEIN: fibrocystin-L-like [Amphiura filiformis]|uniref:LOW QUALITY PROTEIN: fibrocystin-L-like n=1 Tax=Amphiura filiformis TaxID=82378 RepID=UPI003B21FA42